MLWLCLLADLDAEDEFYGPVMESDKSAASFTLSIRDLPVRLRLMSIFVLPQESVQLKVVDGFVDKQFDMEATAGTVQKVTPVRWQWTAPTEPGIYSVTVIGEPLSDTMTLNMFVMLPFNKLKNGYINGYRIGKYPGIPYKNLPQYKPPKGFIEVTAENDSISLTPHFRLKQFVCKQDGGFRKYVVLREELLIKLEMILASVNERGYFCRTFNILSGYRTPWYNHSIGNVKYSRHLWGGAADIFVDESPADNMMDDLNKDGRSDWRDAAIIYDIVDEMYGKRFYEGIIGGLARYRRSDRYGPFVHVDVRGFRARWGD